MKMIIGSIEFKTTGVLQLGEQTREGFNLWTLKIKDTLKEQLNNNSDLKVGLKVGVYVNDNNEIEQLSYLKSM